MRTAMLVAASLLCGGATAQQFTLVESGAPQAVVQLRENPTDVETLARDELCKYVKLATGADLCRTANAGGRVVLNVRGEGPEGFTLDVTPERVRLSAATPVSLLQGVYRFLQEFVGCRWYVGGEIGEVIPEAHTITIPVGTHVERPSWRVRTFFLRDDPEYWWALRNGLNGWFSREFVDSLGSGVEDDLLYQQPGVGGFHAWFRILDPKEYRDEHPEYYALVGGRRVQGGIHSGQICTSNEEVINLIAHKARTYFQEDPGARYYSIAPNDGYGWCQCEHCMRLEAELGGPRPWPEQPARLIVSDRQVQFANEVARRALPGLEGRELIIFAYVSHAPPPLKVRPAKGVTVWLCHYAPACYAHPIDDPNCPRNAAFYEYVQGWAECADRMGYYAYTDKSMWKGLPRPVVPQMMRDIKTLYRLGWRRYVAQSSARNWGQMGSLYWTTARLLWDVNANVDKLQDDWYRGFYGPAGPAMRQFVEGLQEAVADSGEHFTANPDVEGPKVFSVEALAAASLRLKVALEAADTEQVRERVEKRLASFEGGASRLAFAREYARYNETGDKAALEKAVAAGQELAKRSDARFRRKLRGLELELQTGMAWVGVGEPEEKGGRTCYNSDETGLGDGAAGWMTLETVLKDRSKPYVLELVVWGESAGFTPVICSQGKGAGYAAGGIWEPLELIEGELSGKAQWDTIKWLVKPEQFDPEDTKTRIGFGGADSQIWLADARLYPQK